MNVRLQGIIGVCIAQTVLGTIGASVLESGADSSSVAFYRCVFGAAVIACYCILRGDITGIAHPSRKEVMLAVVSGALMVANWVLFFEGIQRAGIAVATILFHIQPFFVVILGAVFFRERMRMATFAWFALALTGLALATGLTAEQIETDQFYLIGIGCTLIASLLYAFVTVIAKGLTGMQAPHLALVHCLCGALLLAPLIPVGAVLGPGDLTAPQWGWLALIGTVHTGGVYVVLYGALPKLTTPVIAALLFLYPASAVVIDALVYGQVLELPRFTGLVFILAASLGVTQKWGIRENRPAPAA